MKPRNRKRRGQNNYINNNLDILRAGKMYFARKILWQTICVSIADTSCIVDEQFPMYFIIK